MCMYFWLTPQAGSLQQLSRSFHIVAIRISAVVITYLCLISLKSQSDGSLWPATCARGSSIDYDWLCCSMHLHDGGAGCNILPSIVLLLQLWLIVIWRGWSLRVSKSSGASGLLPCDSRTLHIALNETSMSLVLFQLQHMIHTVCICTCLAIWEHSWTYFHHILIIFHCISIIISDLQKFSVNPWGTPILPTLCAVYWSQGTLDEFVKAILLVD